MLMPGLSSVAAVAAAVHAKKVRRLLFISSVPNPSSHERLFVGKSLSQCNNSSISRGHVDHHLLSGELDIELRPLIFACGKLAQFW